jgi:hypothetical protein
LPEAGARARALGAADRAAGACRCPREEPAADVLELLSPGARIEDLRPEAGGAVVIQVLSGRLRLDVEGQRLELAAGRLVALDHVAPSQIEAVEETAFLIWVSWSEAVRGAAPVA